MKIGTFAPKIISKTRRFYSKKCEKRNIGSTLRPVLLILLCLLSLSSTTQYKNNLSEHRGPTHGATVSHQCFLDDGLKAALIQSEIINVNFLARYKFGNKRQNGLKIGHLNMGSAYLSNKMNEIENLVSNYTPHVFGISESNFKSDHNKEDVQLPGYQLFLANTLNNAMLNISRIAVYVHEDVVKPKLRTDLMNDTFSSIWLELGLKRQKKILVCNIYREWQYLGQGDDHSSLSIEEQNNRFIQFLDQWEAAIDTGLEIHVLGDFNINFLNWSCLLYTSPSPRD